MQLQLSTEKNTRVSASDKAASLWYAETLAGSLILYAGVDDGFADEFRQMVKGMPGYRPVEMTMEVHWGFEAIMPRERTAAVRRADWLLRSIRSGSLPGGEKARQMLYGWAGGQALAVPKQIVVGIFATSIMGPTAGRLTRRNSMSCVLRSDLSWVIDHKVSAQISRAGLGIMAGAMEMSGGDISKLEPDTADWFFGDREIFFYRATEKQMEKIEIELSRAGIMTAGEEIGGRRAVLAVSPAFNQENLADEWRLERIRQ